MKPAFFFAVPLTGRKGWRTPGQTPAVWKRFTIEWEWRRFLGDAISELVLCNVYSFESNPSKPPLLRGGSKASPLRRGD